MVINSIFRLIIVFLPIILINTGCANQQIIKDRNDSENSKKLKWISDIKKITVFKFRSVDRKYYSEANYLNSQLVFAFERSGVCEIAQYDEIMKYSPDIDPGIAYVPQKSLKKLAEIFKIDGVFSGELIDTKAENYSTYEFYDKNNLFNETSIDKKHELVSSYVTRINIIFQSTRNPSDRLSYNFKVPAGSLTNSQLDNIAGSILNDILDKSDKYPWKKKNDISK